MNTIFIVFSYLLALGLLLLLSRVLLVVVHELGHGLAALALQPGRADLFLGSYGKTKGGGRLRLGRMRIYFRYNPLAWARGGMCRCSGMTAAGQPLWRGLVYLLAGAFLPLVVGVVLLALTFSTFSHWPNVLKALPVLFLVIALLSALSNLWPRRRPLAAGSAVMYTDGMLTRRLLGRDRTAHLAKQADAALAAGRYAESAHLLATLLARLGPVANLYRQLIQAHWQLAAYAPALAASQQFQQELAAGFTDGDRFLQALLFSRTDQHPQALAGYTALIEQAPPYAVAYNNRGYTYNLLGKHELALADFDQAIAAECNVAYAHVNRGLALLKLSQEAAGLADIKHGLALDPANAYGYRNLGIYHLDQGEYATALTYFEQARQHDPTTHQLDTYLQKAHQHLAQSAGTGGPIY